METEADLLLTGVLGRCADCASEQILVPVDRSGELCCTLCDAAFFLWESITVTDVPGAGNDERNSDRRVA
ncbi:MAG TPA: hypothetical protein VFX53_03055 [Pedococcus sp.]|nr:hypothetical protein [Pedococcus sp.]